MFGRTIQLQMNGRGKVEISLPVLIQYMVPKVKNLNRIRPAVDTLITDVWTRRIIYGFMVVIMTFLATWVICGVTIPQLKCGHGWEDPKALVLNQVSADVTSNVREDSLSQQFLISNLDYGTQGVASASNTPGSRWEPAVACHPDGSIW